MRTRHGLEPKLVHRTSEANGRKLQDARRFSVIQRAAGMDRRISTFEMPLKFAIAGRSAILHRALVMAKTEHSQNGISCTLGADAIAALAPLSVDFSRMSIMFE